MIRNIFTEPIQILPETAEVMKETDEKCSILIVDDEPAILELLARQLESDFELVTAKSAALARSILQTQTVDIVLTDLNLPDATGINLLEWVRINSPKTARVLLTGTAKLRDAVEAINCCRIDRLILKPWRGEDILAHLKDVSKGLLISRSHDRLVVELQSLNQQLERRVADRTQELRSSNQILEKMALTDPLTSLPNRRAIDLIARKELVRRSRNGTPLALGLVDADRFKLINTKHFLTGGDHALVCLARTLQQALRTTDAIGRVGGEEFLVIAPETDRAGAEIIAERLRNAVESADIRFHGEPISLTISLGFAVVEGKSTTTYDALREVAAEALNRAKSEGRNRVEMSLLDSVAVN